jgi:hypothetical protein
MRSPSEGDRLDHRSPHVIAHEISGRASVQNHVLTRTERRAHRGELVNAATQQLGRRAGTEVSLERRVGTGRTFTESPSLVDGGKRHGPRRIRRMAGGQSVLHRVKVSEGEGAAGSRRDAVGSDSANRRDDALRSRRAVAGGERAGLEVDLGVGEGEALNAAALREDLAAIPCAGESPSASTGLEPPLRRTRHGQRPPLRESGDQRDARCRNHR